MDNKNRSLIIKDELDLKINKLKDKKYIKK